MTCNKALKTLYIQQLSSNKLNLLLKIGSYTLSRLLFSKETEHCALKLTIFII